MKRTRITKEMETNIVSDYQSGLSSVKLADKYGINPSTVFNILKRSGLSARSNSINSRKYICDYDYFENVDTEEKAYWLGFIYADGWISKQKYGDYFGITLSTKDIDHLHKLKESMQSTYNINSYVHDTDYKDNTEYSVYKVCSKKVVADLIDKGVFENKTDIIEPPKGVPHNLVRHFIRGYFDGDGSFSYFVSNKNKNMYQVKILGTESLLDYINDFVDDSLGFRIPRYFKRRDHQTVMSYELSSKKRAMAFLDFIYKDATIYLDRKYDKYISLKQ